MVEFSLLWLTFFGAAYVLREKKHIEVDLLVGNLNPKSSIWFKIITSFVGCAVSIVLTYYAAIVVWENYRRDINVLKALETPKFIVLLPIFFGSLLLAIQFLIQAMNLIKKKKTTNIESGSVRSFD